MTTITSRLRRRLRADFGDEYREVVDDLVTAEPGGQDRERVLAAIVLGAGGDRAALRDLTALSRLDWRDVLVAGGLEHDGWHDRLAVELGSGGPAVDLDEVTTAYTEMADAYIEHVGGVAGMHADDLALIDRHLGRAGDRVLDAGCGPGHVTAWLRSSGVEAIGVDLTPGFIAHARTTDPDGAYAVGAIGGLPFRDGSFDGVLAWYSLIHRAPEHLNPALADLRRVLRLGGTVVTGSFGGHEHRSFAHAVTEAWYWPADRFADRLRQAGFTVIDIAERPGVDRSGERPHATLVAIAD